MPLRILFCAGGTRFIGVYLARMLVEAGHEVTLYTRGKKAITEQIADDTNASYSSFARKVQHIAGDRKVGRVMDRSGKRGDVSETGSNELHGIPPRQQSVLT